MKGWKWVSIEQFIQNMIVVWSRTMVVMVKWAELGDVKKAKSTGLGDRKEIGLRKQRYRFYFCVSCDTVGKGGIHYNRRIWKRDKLHLFSLLEDSGGVAISSISYVHS